MNRQKREVTLILCGALMGLAFIVPVTAQEEGTDTLTRAERHARLLEERQARREEFLANNPEIAERLEQRRAEWEARRAERQVERDAFLANHPELAARIDERQARREEFLANNPEIAERMNQRRGYRRYGPLGGEFGTQGRAYHPRSGGYGFGNGPRPGRFGGGPGR